ncbi:DUF4158 domain-containing protein [Streptomyces sp. NPDC046685]|uniref:DUF4158 domain-containing protein n=1 Tax=Streptomyces sp. NPDC046685 TaxID=3157202 RepID=UPI0033E83289
MAARVFSDEELEGLRSFPAIGKDELIRYFTLAPADAAFLRKFLRPQTVFGAAVQLCTLPWLGFVPDEVFSAPPPAAVGRLAGQLGLPVEVLRGYGVVREQTRTDHLRQVVCRLHGPGGHSRSTPGPRRAWGCWTAGRGGPAVV